MKQNEVIRITLVGDIFPGELIYTKDYGIRSQFERHKGKPWLSKIINIIGDNDIVIGNLESPLVDEKNIIKKTFYGHPEFSLFLKKCGINVINVANNHILEQGIQGFESTIQALNKAETAVIGQISEAKSNIYYKIVNGKKIAIAGFSNVDLHVINNDNNFAVLTVENVLKTLKEMEEANANIKILSFHWGNEYVHVPSLEQRKMAFKFIDQGANIIVGHHPHVIQPFETYNGGHIFYSLGNFMFDYIHSQIFSIGLVVKILVAKDNQIHSTLHGIELSYKNTITQLSQKTFEKYYLKILDQFSTFIKLTDEEYEKKYQSLLLKNHIQQRILMKTSLIKEFLRINRNDKGSLCANVFKFYFKIK